MIDSSWWRAAKLNELRRAADAASVPQSGMDSAHPFKPFFRCYTVRAQTGIADLSLNRDVLLRDDADNTRRAEAPPAQMERVKIGNSL